MQNLHYTSTNYIRVQFECLHSMLNIHKTSAPQALPSLSCLRIYFCTFCAQDSSGLASDIVDTHFFGSVPLAPHIKEIDKHKNKQNTNTQIENRKYKNTNTPKVCGSKWPNGRWWPWGVLPIRALIITCGPAGSWTTFRNTSSFCKKIFRVENYTRYYFLTTLSICLVHGSFNYIFIYLKTQIQLKVRKPIQHNALACSCWWFLHEIQIRLTDIPQIS